MSKKISILNNGYIPKAFKSKSDYNTSCLLLLAVTTISLLAVYMLSLPTYVSIAHAQTPADKSGTIASTQNDQAGTWKLSGTWKFNNLNSNSPTFTSTFSMVKLDGSSVHKHTINNFKITGNPTKTSTATTYTGTATISMKGGPVSNVPISINLLDNWRSNYLINY